MGSARLIRRRGTIYKSIPTTYRNARVPAHQKVPEPPTGEADQLNVRLNKVAPLERLGISSADVAAEIGKLLESRHVSAENPDDLGQLKIKIDGHEFRLHEIAEISITKEPRCIARNLSGRRIR